MGTLLHLLQVVDGLFAGILPSMKSDKSDTHKKGLISLKSLIRKWNNGENFDKKLLIAKKWSCLLLQNMVFAVWKALKWWFYVVNQWKIRCFDFCCVQNVCHRTTPLDIARHHSTPHDTIRHWTQPIQNLWRIFIRILELGKRNSALYSKKQCRKLRFCDHIKQKYILFTSSPLLCCITEHSISSRNVFQTNVTIFVRRMVNLNYSQELKRINARKTT